MLKLLLIGAGAVILYATHEGKMPMVKKHSIWGYGAGAGLILGGFLFGHGKFGCSSCGGGPGLLHPPMIHPAAAGYSHNPSIPYREPLGYLTGPGLDNIDTPESSILPFPDNVARARSGL